MVFGLFSARTIQYLCLFYFLLQYEPKNVPEFISLKTSLNGPGNLQHAKLNLPGQIKTQHDGNSQYV